jgi:pre-mRNA 3'-end-processing factor FIP1
MNSTHYGYVPDSQQAQSPSVTLALLNVKFSYHRTAFDVDIDALEEKPWRNPGVDISDFFNYGFTEATWRNYCEKQLRYRAKHGEKEVNDSQGAKSTASAGQRASTKGSAGTSTTASRTVQRSGSASGFAGKSMQMRPSATERRSESQETR